MKYKLEKLFYTFVVIFAIFVLIGNIIVLGFYNDKPKTTYEISAPPVIDSFGNLYYFKRTYNHKPTKEDSIDFQKEKEVLFK